MILRNKWRHLRALLLPLATLGSAEAAEVSYGRDVMAVISKAGCNAGNCHGKQEGRGGLKLSLWGEDPAADHTALRANEKRVKVADPAASLILRKPTLQEKHEGEKRFEVDSEEYRILRAWIEAGAPAEREDAATLVSLAVSPPIVMLEDPRRDVQLSVSATFSDGEVRDVTPWAVFETSNVLAEAGSDGLVRFSQPGETTVFVRYLGGRATARLALIAARPDFKWTGPMAANAVDQRIFAKLQRYRENPAPACDDATFIRRASLDITGRLPEARAARAFVADEDPEKRAKLIEALLASPEYAEFWALKWADLLRVEEKTLDAKGVEKFYGWLRDRLADGMPLDEMARTILSATGSTYEHPPANYYRALRKPVERAEATAQVFLGSRLKCAQCHNHPFEAITQDDYYRFAALFDGIDYEIVENKRGDKHDKHQFKGEQRVKLVALADIEEKERLKHPRTKEPPIAGLLDPSAAALTDHSKRLEEMAAWVTAQEEFGLVQANRIWFHMMGRALIDPIDDVRTTNPASNPELMNLLATELRGSGYDARHLIRLIASSRSYAVASDPGVAPDVGSAANFARATVRRHPAEVIVDAAHRALAVAGEFKDAHKSVRAIGMPGVERVHRANDATHDERFLKLFGKPPRLINSDAERSDETTLGQVFELIGGATMDSLLSEPGNRLGGLIKAGSGDSEIIDELYWSTLTRAPTSGERSAMLAHLANADDRRSGLEDIAWSLLNAKEFLLRR